MFLAERFRASRVLSVGVAASVIGATALVAASPVQADEVYPRPWDNTVTLSGHGWGHGHGMSQWGAYGAALKGRTWPQIVDFYYPNTVRTQIGNPLIRVSATGALGRTAVVKAESGLRATFGPQEANALALPLLEYPVPNQIVRYAVTRAPLVSGVKTAALLRYKLADGTWKTYKTEPSGRINLSRVPVSTDPTSNQLHVYDTSGTVLTYRAALRATLIGSAGQEVLTPIMALPMESYLRGVVPSESISSWPLAALAAQAVAARSYAKYAIDHPRGPGYYDTCDTTACQVFKGLATEPTSTNTAITASAGVALYYGGAAAFTEFGSSNGGWSADGGRPYLIAQFDPYDVPATDPVHTWQASVPVSSIETRWPSIGSYRQLRIISRDGHGQWGGRVLQASVEGSTGSVAVTGAEIRKALGLKSEWFVPTNLRSAPSYPRDFTSDRKADVLAVVAKTGYLRLYPGNGASSWKPTILAGTGFGVYSKVFTAGTWDVDALSDVMAQKSDGTLWLYPGTAAGPLGTPRRIGSSWNLYNLVFPVGDFGGDGLTDLLARRSDGVLMLFSGNGSGGFLSARKVGSGWGSLTSVFSPGDFNGDGRADVLARTADGLLYLYPGNGSGGWLPRQLVSAGWNKYSSIISPGDFSGDGRSDLLVRSTDGYLWMYAGNGVGGVLEPRLVGSGWNIFSTVLP
jgi:stage II sporulation protein D